jgi:hypothetical protein
MIGGFNPVAVKGRFKVNQFVRNLWKGGGENAAVAEQTRF